MQVRQAVTPHGGGWTQQNRLLRESARLASLACRVGKRLAEQLRQLPDDAPVPPDFVEAARWYSAAVTGLLREQRERIKLLGPGDAKTLTADEYRTELDALVRETLRTMPEDELRGLLAERGGAAVLEVAPTTPDEAPEPAPAMPFDFGGGGE